MSFKWWPFRRLTQVLVIALIASPLLGLTFFRGNLSAGELFGISLADPLAVLQVIAATGIVIPAFLGAGLIIAGLYLATGGRTFCGWICPVYLVTELNEKLRARLETGNRAYTLSGIRWSLLATLVVSVAASIPLFEVLSPIGITARAILFGSLGPLLLLAAILVVELLVAKRVWCRTLCPVGGFYSLLGTLSPIRIGFKKELCTHCGECSRVCPVEEVLEQPLKEGARQVASGHCTRCADCVDVCPTKALGVDTWYR